LLDDRRGRIWFSKSCLALRALKVGTRRGSRRFDRADCHHFDSPDQGIASQKPTMRLPGEVFWQRNPWLVCGTSCTRDSCTLLVAGGAGTREAAEKRMTITTAPWWGATNPWLVQALFDYIEAVRTFLVLYD